MVMELPALLTWMLLVGGGLLSGLLNGCLGLGGMSVFLPVLIWIFRDAVPADGGLVPSALMNAFAAMVVMGLASWRSHHHQDNIRYPHLVPVASGSLLGTGIGFSAAAATGLFATMDVLFGIYLILAGIHSLMQGTESVPRETRTSGLLAIGIGGGFLGGIVGFNGNTVFIPLLRRSGLNIKEAIATGQVSGIVVALVMVLLLGATFGFNRLNASIFVPLSIAAIAGSHVGAAIKKRVGMNHMKFAFAGACSTAGLVLALKLTH